MSRTSVNPVRTLGSRASRTAASILAEDVPQRTEIPVRASFVRGHGAGGAVPPLARLVSTRGRGGAVPLKLYLALIWRCSAPPYSTDILARQWALLLDLNEPNTLGARRITNALDVLEQERLVGLERRRGDSTMITLLEESGSGAVYTLPSTAYATARTDDARLVHRYFKMPIGLWTRGYAQDMGAPALAMLLLLLADRNRDGRPTWWSVERFEGYGISSTNRTAGTKELREKGLVTVTKTLVDPGRGRESFRRERVRNNYQLAGPARPAEMVEAARRRRKKVLAQAGLTTAGSKSAPS